MAQNLSIQMFGKGIHDLTEADVINCFELQQRETNTLEFKSYVDDSRVGGTKPKRDAQKLTDIIKSICGFLNTDGGILIWGAPSPTKVAGEEDIYCGPPTQVDYKIQADQFTSIIASEISPTPLRVLFQPIRLPGDKFIYVFEVDRSEFAPHQYKGTYYMRLDGSTRYAPHRYVEALIKRITFPKIEGVLTFGDLRSAREYANMTVQLTIHNRSKLINDKNVSYQLLVSGADLVNINTHAIERLHNGTSIDKLAREVLHYKMPYYEHFVLVFDRRTQAREIVLTLNVWGELSPVIMSTYKMVVNPTRQGTLTNTITKHENFYLMDTPDNMVNEGENETADEKLLKMFEENSMDQPIYRHIYNMGG